MEKKFVSVVVYLHNCEDSVENFLSVPLEWIRTTFEHYELVCVDDACTDQTISKLKKYVVDKHAGDTVTIVRMDAYQGVESAMNAGRDISIGDFVFEFDSAIVDYPLEMLSKAYQSIACGSDIATVSPEDGLKLSSRLFYGIFNRFSRGTAKISSETFRVVSRRAINRIKSVSDYIPYRKAVYANCGLNTEILYYKANQKKHPKEDRTYERMNLAFDSFIYFTNFLERLSMLISAFFLLFSVGSVTYAIWDRTFNGAVIEGWTSIICFLSFGFFGVFLLMTIILKYLSVILNLIFKRQKYLVSSIEKVGGQS